MVVHAGRLAPQKNQRMLLEAFAQFAVPGRDLPESELWILGEGGLRGDLESRARELGIANRVRWLGFQSNPYPFFRAADVFALSSDHEGLPNAVIEAALCETPSVSTRCPYGPDELIDDGETGLLAPVGDARAFAAALTELARDRDASRRMGALARERCASRFDTSTVCAGYQSLFERLVEG